MSESALDTLARIARDGGRREMEVFLRELRPMVCRWALAWTGSPDAAEDVAQRVMIRVCKSFESYSEEGKLTTWVYRITRNALIDRERKEDRENSVRDTMRLEYLARTVMERDAGCGDGSEVWAQLNRMMERLSPQQRAVLDLVSLQGFTTVEAGEMLEVAPATIRVHLHRARQALRAQGD